MKQFKYNVVKLIEAVRDRPCLWDKTTENYKDRIERKSAWDEIFHLMDKRYEAMSADDKRLTSEIIVSKWTNIRDTFVKTIRKKGRKVKRYILYDHLTFLIPLIQEANEDQDNLGYEDEQNESQKEPYENTRKYEHNKYEDSEDSDEDSSPVFKPSSSKKKKVKKESHGEEVPVTDAGDTNNPDFVSVDGSRLMNEDEAFFASLLPSVVKYTEDERLEFRIEVLSLMKRINDQRKWPSNS